MLVLDVNEVMVRSCLQLVKCNSMNFHERFWYYIYIITWYYILLA